MNLSYQMITKTLLILGIYSYGQDVLEMNIQKEGWSSEVRQRRGTWRGG